MRADAQRTAHSHHTRGVDEPASSLERERKFEVPHDITVPELLGIAGVHRVSQPQHHELLAHYFDTTELTLARHGRVLRHRFGGHDSGWHVKQRTAKGVRETQWPAASDVVESIPQAVLSAVTDLVSEDQLQVIATISTQRTARLLYLTDQSEPVAEIADDRVTTVDRRTGQQRHWREWEVELLNTTQDDDGEAFLDLIEDELVAAGAVASADNSKLQRALKPN